MKKIFLFEFSLFKHYKKYFFIFLLIICLFVIIGSLIPSFAFKSSGYLGYPRVDGVEPSQTTKDIYKKELQELYKERIEQSKKNGSYKKELNIYEFYLETDTCEYDYLKQSDLYVSYLYYEGISASLSLVEMMTITSIFISFSVAAYLFLLPHKNKYLKNMVLIGIDRNTIYNNKMLLGYILLTAITLLITIISLIIICPLNIQVLIPLDTYYTSTNIYSILFSKLLALYISMLFYYSLSLLVGFLAKKLYMGVALPILLFIIFVLVSANNPPNWGQLAHLDGNLTQLFLPFSNLLEMPSYGFTYMLLFMILFYIIIISSLYFINKKIFLRLSL